MRDVAKASLKKDGRSREIAGIGLLGLGIFSVLSMISMQAGSNKMMGPGGAAAAAGLYSLAGASAYIAVAFTLVLALRCFQGRILRRGTLEIFGTLGLLASAAVLCHLPFAAEPVMLRGPGGLLGQWLGEIAASFIGGAGAALAASMLLCVSLLLLTDVRVAEVIAVIAWAARHLGRGLAAAARGMGRVVLALFPEKDDRKWSAGTVEHQDDAHEGAGEEVDEEVKIFAADAAPAPMRELHATESEAVRIGRARSFRDEEASAPLVLDEPDAIAPEDEARQAVAALVAEVAAAECAALAALRSLAPSGPEPAPPQPSQVVASSDEDAALEAPIIVEPAFRPRPRTEDHPARRDEAGPGFIQLSDGAFTLPSMDLLGYQAPSGVETDKQALMDMAGRLEQAMVNYGVQGKVKEIHMGPVVNMFEYAAAPGTRTGKIGQLENDLAMALEAQAVRIVAPIPGKNAVGVEVPNADRQTVYLKEILLDDSYRQARAKLQVALGKDIKGAPVSVNLAKMPHLLVAGTTGSGKSVAINAMITSLLFNATPEEVRFIMVDPKMLELSVYEGIPHLLLPVVTDPKKANLALRWAVEEMERRYELLSTVGVRDIASYNARIDAGRPQAADGVVAAPLHETPSKRARRLKVLITGEDGLEQEIEVDAESAPVPEPAVAIEESSEPPSQDAAGPPPRKLPYVVIVIDEFADLMMVAPKDVETSVARLAQKARAAGLHLILATQRPSVDVITGLIKANFPSRIALQVASKIDSRTILDQPGAETLLGNGDMLFSDRGTKLRRVHGAFLSDQEVHRVVEVLKKQAKPVYDMDILKPRDEDLEDGDSPADDFHDELYDRAIALVCETRQASVSYIQRRLQIGYNRSARMVDQMERDGIVGPANGIKPREVLAPPGEYLTAAS